MKKSSLIVAALALASSIAAAPKKAAATPPQIAAPTVPAAAPAATSAASGEKASREVNKIGLGIWLGGADGLAGGYLSYYILPIIDIEVGGMSLSAGSFSYLVIHGGPKWHFLGGNAGQRWSPYVGAEIQYISAKTDVSVGGTTATGSATGIGIYVPLGLELVAFNGFNFAFEVAYNYVPTISVEASANGQTSKSDFSGIGGVWGGLKLGWRF
jgi:hypothetical protein